MINIKIFSVNDVILILFCIVIMIINEKLKKIEKRLDGKR